MGKVIAAGIFIVRKDNKVLVCHPTRHKLDFWSIPKGKINDGETHLKCAIRETYEETNIDLSDKNIFFKIYPLEAVNYRHKKKILFPFLYLENENSSFDWDSIEIKCNSSVSEDRGDFLEMDDYKWLSTEEARPLLHDTQAACLNKILEIINGVKHTTLTTID